jgi:hypothetical protein
VFAPKPAVRVSTGSEKKFNPQRITRVTSSAECNQSYQNEGKGRKKSQKSFAEVQLKGFVMNLYPEMPQQMVKAGQTAQETGSNRHRVLPTLMEPTGASVRNRIFSNRSGHGIIKKCRY